MTLALAGQALWGWAKQVPYWVWVVIALIITGKLIHNDGKSDGYREAEDEITHDIEEQTNERLERARKARAEIEHRPSDGLNARQLDQLRQRREADPHNRGGL